MKKRKLLSLVVPAHKQEKTIVQDIKSLDNSLSLLGSPYEIIVVVDGFLDKTFEKAKSIDLKNVKVYGYRNNMGKGYAVKFGSLKTKGDIVGFIDAGMDIDPSGIGVLLNYLFFHNADIVIGSKLHPDSIVDYPVQRKIISWGYRELTHFLFGLDIKDTQVGFKLFRRKVLENVFPQLLVKQFAFDIEALAVANFLGYGKIYEAPVNLKFTGWSSITARSFWKIIFFTFWDTIAVFYRLKIMRYYKIPRKNPKK